MSRHPQRQLVPRSDRIEGSSLHMFTADWLQPARPSRRQHRAAVYREPRRTRQDSASVDQTLRHLGNQRVSCVGQCGALRVSCCVVSQARSFVVMSLFSQSCTFFMDGNVKPPCSVSRLTIFFKFGHEFPIVSSRYVPHNISTVILWVHGFSSQLVNSLFCYCLRNNGIWKRYEAEAHIIFLYVFLLLLIGS